jgi:hypothetical protein
VEVNIYGTHQLQVCADHAKPLGNNIKKEDIRALTDASKEVEIQVNTEKRKYSGSSNFEWVDVRIT